MNQNDNSMSDQPQYPLANEPFSEFMEKTYPTGN